MNKTQLIILGLIIFAALAAGGVKVYSATRGFRNNNPLNIRHGDDWLGLSDEQTDADFCQYVDVVYGIRAGARILQNYAKGGINTIEKIIKTWAPPSDNNPTENYIQNVCAWTGFDRKKVISKNSGDYLPLIKAMIRQENGLNPYSDDTILHGISLA